MDLERRTRERGGELRHGIKLDLERGIRMREPKRQVAGCPWGCWSPKDQRDGRCGLGGKGAIS